MRKEYVGVLIQPENKFINDLFENVIKNASNNNNTTLISLAANYIVSDIVGLMQVYTNAPEPASTPDAMDFS